MNLCRLYAQTQCMIATRFTLESPSRITAWQSACMCSPALLVLLLALCDHARQRFPSSQHALCNSVYTLTHTEHHTHTHAPRHTHTHTHTHTQYKEGWKLNSAGGVLNGICQWTEWISVCMDYIFTLAWRRHEGQTVTRLGYLIPSAAQISWIRRRSRRADLWTLYTGWVDGCIQEG